MALILMALALFGDPAEIRVGAYLINAGKLDLASGSYTVDLYLTFEADPALPESYAKGDSKDLPFEFINGRAERVELTDVSPRKIVYRIQANLYGPVDLRLFPFDRQTLIVRLEDKRNRQDRLRFIPKDADLGVDPGVIVIGWTLDPPRHEAVEHSYPDQEVFHQYVMSLQLRRGGISAILRVFVPISCFLFVSFITLLLGPDAYDKRLGTNTGMLIASVMFHVAIMGSLPPLGYLTLADRLLIATYLTIGFHVWTVVRMMRHWLRGDKLRAEGVHRRSRWSIPFAALLAYAAAATSLLVV